MTKIAISVCSHLAFLETSSDTKAIYFVKSAMIMHVVKMLSRSDTWHGVNLAHAPLLFVRIDFRYISRTGIYRARSVCYIYSGARVTDVQ